jgi:formate hydrogenlyase subunit 4
MADLMHALVLQGGQMFLVLVLAPLLMGVVRRIKARLQRRRGADLLQPYYDLWKLLRKEVVPAENASRFYRIAPYVIFAAIWVAAALVPTFASGLMFNWSADLIVIVGLLATARFTLALAGMDVGTSFGGIGASREMMIAVFAEPAMLMVVFTLSMLAHSTQLSAIADYLILQPVGLRISLGLTLVTFTIVLLAENARIPVDNPATHLELTMVHEAMLLEYSGRHLALLEFAAAIKLLLYVSIFICLFFPFGMATGAPAAAAILVGVLLYLLKLGIGGSLLALGESAVAKMRVFRLGEFLGMAFVLGLLAVLLLFVTRGVRG